MPQNDVNLLVGAITTPFETSVNQASARIEKNLSAALGRGLSNAGKSFSLGRITGDFKEFDKSLESSNARVLAFGASAGIILGTQRAFSALVRETINVEKSLTDINVILNLSTRNLTAFGSKLFDIAKNTGQAFSVVAEAATELSRQGLNVEETLKRTNDALVLSRQSGLDAASSVKAITAALNSFTKEALTSSQIINKLANVDAQFAVSSADLAEAISRVGSTAQDAGVGLNELLGLVTSVQQTTSRGGAVIGNALKSIFTRISRPEVIEQLQELGVEINQAQNGVDKLKGLSAALKQASPAQASIIKELAGGVFQVNILAAALGDLQNKYSVTTRATQAATNATDEAIQRNVRLNQTYAALINTTLANFQQVGSQFGKLAIGPALERVLGGINTVLEGAISQKSDNLGEILGRGLLKGLGEFLGGPGLAVIGLAIVKLIGKLASEAGTAFKTIIGLNDAARERAGLENNILGILSRQPDLIALAQTSELGLLQAVKLVNAELARQTAFQSSAREVASLAATAVIKTRPKANVGFIPERQEKEGAYAGGYTPGQVREMTIPKLGKVIYNTAEQVKTFPGFSQPAIIPPQNSKAGINYDKSFIDRHGFSPYKAEGLVPNYINPFIVGKFPPRFGDSVIRAEEQLHKSGLYLKNAPISLNYGGSKGNVLGEAFGPAIYPPGGAKSQHPYINLYSISEGSVQQTLFHEYGHTLDQLIAKQNLSKNKLGSHDLLGSNPTEKLKYYQGENAADLFASMANYRIRDKNSNFNKPNLKGQALGIVEQYEDFLNKFNSGSLGNVDDILARYSKFKFSKDSFSKGLIPNYANPKDSLLSYLSEVDPKYVRLFRGIQKQDTGLAKFLRQSADLKNPAALKQMNGFLKKDLLQYTPSKFGLDTTSYVNLNDSPENIRKSIKAKFNEFNMGGAFESNGLIPNYANQFNLPSINLESPYTRMTHFSSNLKKLRELPTIFEKTDYIKELDRAGIIKYAGRGSSRLAFDVGDDYVLKLARANDQFSDRTLERGFNQNRVEANPLLKEYRDIVPSVYEAAPDYSYLISEKAQPFNEKIFSETTGLKSIHDLGDIVRGGPQSGDKFHQRFSQLFNDKRLNLVPDLTDTNFGLGLRGGKASPLLLDVGIDKDIAKRLYDFSSGLVPNFSPLREAIKREVNTGVSLSQIKVGSDSRLASKSNPAGLGVYNLRDEPRGLQQGIHRALSQGFNPKTYGGATPNFAIDTSTFGYEFGAGQRERAFFEKSYSDLASKVQSGVIPAKEAAGEINKLNLTIKALPDTIERIKRSFYGLESVFKTLNASPLLTSAQKISKTGGLYPASQAGLANVTSYNLRAQIDSLIAASGPKLLTYNRPKSNVYTPLGVSEQLQFPGFSSKDLINQQAILAAQQYNPNFIINPSNRGFRGNLLNAPRQPFGLLGPGRVFAGQPIPQISYFRGGNPYQTINPSFLRQTQTFRNANDFVNDYSNPYYFGAKPPAPSFLDKAKGKYSNFINSPSLRNNALLASFVLPTVAGVVSESFGDKTPERRGAAQTARSLGNIASYGALGASFGGLGLPIGVGIGAALETPKIIQAFKDKTPDIDRELGKLAENLNAANDGFSGLIQTNEKLNQYQRGELKLSPRQYGEIQISKRNQINQLATRFPNFAEEIRRAGESGDIEQASKVLSSISNYSQLKQQKLQISQLREGIKPSFFGGLPNKDNFSDYVNAQILQTSTNQDNKAQIPDFLIQNPKILNKLDEAFKTFDEAAVVGNKYRQYVQQGTIGRDENGVRITKLGYNEKIEGALGSQIKKLQEEGRQKLLSAGDEIKSKGGYDLLGKLIEDIQNNNNPEIRGGLIAELKKQLNTPVLKEAVSAPKQDDKLYLRDNLNLLRSFSDLERTIDLFVGKLSIITSSRLSKIQDNLERNISNARTSNAINILRTQPFSPFKAIDLERQGIIQEGALTQQASIEKAKLTTQNVNRTSAINLISQLQDITLKRANQSRLGSQEILPLYQEKLNQNFANLLPRFKENQELNKFNSGFSSGSLFQRFQNPIFDEGSPLRGAATQNLEIPQALRESPVDKSIKDFINNSSSNDLTEFYGNIEKERNNLLSSVSAGRKDSNEIQEIVKLYDSILTDKTLSVQSLNEQINQINEKQATLIETSANEARVKREQVVQSFAQQYYDVVSNIGEFSNGIRDILSKNQNLTGFRAIRANNAEIANQGFQEAKNQYKSGNIDTQQYRGYLNTKADAELQDKGTLSGGTLGSLFGSNFGYNTRDFFSQVKNDTLELGATMRSEFSSAFKSFTDGSQSAGEAARQFGISIATNILNKVADIGFNSLVGGLFTAGSSVFGSLFKGSSTAPAAKSRGGIIGYASGGMVRGGSGVVDDIPAYLPKGSFVLQKSAVNQYGASFLSKLNYGGAVGFDKGGGVNNVLQNSFDITGRKEKTAGAFNIDSRLSVIGQTDENNPQNTRKFAQEQDFYNYQKTIQAYKVAQSQFEAAQNNRLIGAGISAVIGIGGQALGQLFSSNVGSPTAEQSASLQAGNGPVSASYASQSANQNFNNSINPYGTATFYSGGNFAVGRNRGGLMGFSAGGNVDNIPALLTGGEYVMTKEAVNQYGPSFMKELNAGRIPNVARFANGGLVGRDIGSINPTIPDSANTGFTQLVAAIDRQTKTLSDVKDLLSDKNKTNTKNSNDNTSSPSVTNQVTIQINLQDSKASQGTSQTGGNATAQDRENLQKFGELMKNIATKTIIEQQRDGGLLAKSR